MAYHVQGFQTLDTEHGCDAWRAADTLKAARAEALYMLSEAYRRRSEFHTKLACVEIWKGETLLSTQTRVRGVATSRQAK